jgi:flavin reductase (DIM6/NTAB) family NADH-FMN oxidoreductase RutF
MPIDPMQFRNTLAHWASGVTVVTTTHGGLRYGMTASSFSSVSLMPPLILICVGKAAFTHNLILETGSFGVNILSAAQLELGKRFAEKHGDYIDRFSDLDVEEGQRGSPLLTDAVAWLECQTTQAVDAGDHTVFIAEVIDVKVNGGEPLLYVNRMWGTFKPQDLK